MKIILASHVFAPSVGGIETMSATLADEFFRQGHEVKVVTQTPGEGADKWPYEVIRQPEAMQLLKLTWWSDVFFQNNISLQTIWYPIFLRKPLIIACHNEVRDAKGQRGVKEYIKLLMLRFSITVSISSSVANNIFKKSYIVGNCYADNKFYRIDSVERNSNLVFLGRLVTEKGVDVLLKAVRILKDKNIHTDVTVIGDGSELQNLRQLSQELNISNQTNFVGQKSGSELVKLLNKHHIMAVPSVYDEPFGIVALEGIACGCVVVGSEGGGLKDAIGPCGMTFPNGDVQALANVLSELLKKPEKMASFREASARHLKKHQIQAVAQEYIKIFRSAMS